jgi:O-antigen ligase
VARLQEPQRVLTLGAGGAALGERLGGARGVALALLVIGLAASITLSETMLIVLGAWLVWQSLRRHATLSWPLATPVLAFAAWTLIAAALSGEPRTSLAAARPLFLLATLWVVVNAIGTAARARWFAGALFAALVAVSALSIVQVQTCSADRLYAKAVGLPPVLGSFFSKCERAHGFFSIYMTLAGVLTIVLTLMLPRLPTLRHRALAAAGWVVGALALALTLVRGAWLGFGAGVLLLAGTMRRQVVVFAGVLVVGAALLAVPGVRHRAASMADPGDPTARERMAMLSAGLTLLREHPVAGIGPGGVKRLYPEYAPAYAVRRHTSHLHDTPLQIAVERGLVGLALWLWLFAAFFARAVRTWRRLPADAAADRALVAGGIAAVAAFLVAGLFEYNFGDTEVLLVALSVMALPLIVEREWAAT